MTITFPLRLSCILLNTELWISPVTKDTLQCLLLSYYTFQTSKQRVVVAGHCPTSLHTVHTIRTIRSYPTGILLTFDCEACKISTNR